MSDLWLWARVSPVLHSQGFVTEGTCHSTQLPDLGLWRWDFVLIQLTLQTSTISFTDVCTEARQEQFLKPWHVLHGPEDSQV